MKYLKPFINEAVSQDIIELCCVNLFDDDFEIRGYTKEGTTLISLRKVISTALDGTNNRDVVSDHLRNYRDCRVIITGKDFTKQYSTNGKEVSDNVKRIIDMAIDSAIMLKHYSQDSKDRKIEVSTSSRGLQNPWNFEYTHYMTQIDIIFYL